MSILLTVVTTIVTTIVTTMNINVKFAIEYATILFDLKFRISDNMKLKSNRDILIF